MTDLILFLSGASFVGIVLFSWKLYTSSQNIPESLIAPTNWQLNKKVSLIVPAFNEENKIFKCLSSVLNSTNSELIEVIVIDDCSTDKTFEKASLIKDKRLKVLKGKEKPKDWLGKSWACYQAAQVSSGEFVIFLDADVELKARAIENTIYTAEVFQSDLLSQTPQVICQSFAEWLVQPIMLKGALICFNFNEINKPATQKAFAAGPFLTFKRASYESIGGHKSVACEVVEDIAFAKLVKSSGLKLLHINGSKLATLQMYDSFSALWEGWTKNIYLGFDRNPLLTLFLGGSIFVIYSVPYLILVTLVIRSAFWDLSNFDYLSFIFCIGNIINQYGLRMQMQKPEPKFWFLGGLGGAIVFGIFVFSIFKTETGLGWTWRGRKLNLF